MFQKSPVGNEECANDADILRNKMSICGEIGSICYLPNAMKKEPVRAVAEERNNLSIDGEK